MPIPASAAKTLWVLLIALGVALALPARAQDRGTAGITIRRVEIKGLTTVSESFVLRIIKTREGQPYQPDQTQEDIRELLRSRKFLNAFAEDRLEDGQVVVTIFVQEKPTVASLEVVGNKRFDSARIFRELSFSAGSVLDRYEINRGRENILHLYREKGYYYTTVELDEPAQQSEGRVIYRITEGPRVRVRQIVLEGARSFPEVRLRANIRTQTWFPLLIAGAFDEEQAERDALEIQNFYRGEAFLDARCGYRLEFSTVDRSKLTLVFVIEEGVRYRIDSIAVQGNTVFDTDRILGTMLEKPEDLARKEALQSDVKRLGDLYGEIGYVQMRVTSAELPYDFLEDKPGFVRLKIAIDESIRSRFGRITVRGNTHTKDEVVRRELRFYPEEDYNSVKAKQAERRLTDTGLFTRATVTPLEDVNGLREALVEVEEAQTTNFIIGFGVSTDSGVLGTLSIENRNFDLFDWPRNSSDFFRGTAFRGDGQKLRFTFEPGTQITRFRIDFTEPYLFDRNLRYDQSFYLFQRSRRSYYETRYGLVPALSHRFEGGILDSWAIEGALRLEGINIDPSRIFPARDIRAAAGSSVLTSVKGSIVHDTTDSRINPSEGHRFIFSWEQVGALGGDWTFSKPTASFVWYKTTSVDIFDRKSVVALRADMGYISGDAPVFERFYGGGFGSIRGFQYRGVSPRGGVQNDRIGGNFVALAGAEYTYPIYADNFRGAFFLDSGTVEEDFQITDWRVAVGFGLRINVQFWGQVPIVFDFGFPLSQGKDDVNQVFNFSIGASF